MGITAMLVKRHIYRLSADDIFSTRDLLAYGLRKNIDNLLYRLVKSGEIRRLANGVFARTATREREFLPIQIASTKLKAYGKHFWHDQFQLDKQEALEQAQPLTVRVAGSTSSFKIYTGQRIVLQGTAARKMKLGKTIAAEFARALWDTDDHSITSSFIDERFITCELKRVERLELLLAFNLLPAWLNDALCHIRPRYFGAALGNLNQFTTAVNKVTTKSLLKDRVVSGGNQRSFFDRRHSRLHGHIPIEARF